MKTNDTIGLATMSSPTEEPTAASMWHALAGSPITDEFLDWPADVFALTDVILGRSEAYRFALSPPGGLEWPPSHLPSWSEAVEEAGRQWSVWVEYRKSAFPDLLAEEWSVFRERAGMPLEHLTEGRDWRMCEALLTPSCHRRRGVRRAGHGPGRSDGKGCIYRAHRRELLARTGSLARIPSHFLRVLLVEHFSEAGLPRGLLGWRLPSLCGTARRAISQYPPPVVGMRP